MHNYDWGMGWGWGMWLIPSAVILVIFFLLKGNFKKNGNNG